MTAFLSCASTLQEVLWYATPFLACGTHGKNRLTGVCEGSVFIVQEAILLLNHFHFLVTGSITSHFSVTV